VEGARGGVTGGEHGRLDVFDGHGAVAEREVAEDLEGALPVDGYALPSVGPGSAVGLGVLGAAQGGDVAEHPDDDVDVV
jgi:hypothetical protein